MRISDWSSDVCSSDLALALALGLIVKELPFLLLMTLAALGQVRADERLAVARSLGYGPVTAWLKAVLPAVYRQIRLPVYAVLAYGPSVVDMTLILAHLTTPPLPVRVLPWFHTPALPLPFHAAARTRDPTSGRVGKN